MNVQADKPKFLKKPKVLWIPCVCGRWHLVTRFLEGRQRLPCRRTCKINCHGAPFDFAPWGPTPAERRAWAQRAAADGQCRHAGEPEAGGAAPPGGRGSS